VSRLPGLRARRALKVTRGHAAVQFTGDLGSLVIPARREQQERADTDHGGEQCRNAPG